MDDGGTPAETHLSRLNAGSVDAFVLTNYGLVTKSVHKNCTCTPVHCKTADILARLFSTRTKGSYLLCISVLIIQFIFFLNV